MITKADLKQGNRIKLDNGNVFTIEEVTSDFIRTTLNNGIKSNYRNEIEDAILFFNENNSILL